MNSTLQKYIDAVENGTLDTCLEKLYGADELEAQRQRYSSLLTKAKNVCGQGPVLLLTTPGRTELGGNHTDHNLGRVLAAAVHLDCLAAVSPLESNKIVLHSDGFTPVEMDISELAKQECEKETPQAIIRGVAMGMQQRGFKIGGFRACVHSTIPTGVGLSSSAAFEVLIGHIFSGLYNNGIVTAFEMADIAKYAENEYFCKPCGFMDQMACAYKGVVAIDFKDEQYPDTTSIQTDFQKYGYGLLVVDTGGSHADLTDEYAAMPREMKAVAKHFGQAAARGLSTRQVLDAIPVLRKIAGDRAIMRVLHFIEEDERAQLQAQALDNKDIDTYIQLVRDSGDSSWRLLQNVMRCGAVEDQPIPLALTLTQRFLNNTGAWRVHGGGVAGTIQVYVPLDLVESYTMYMENIFGKGAVVSLKIRQPDTECIQLT